MNPFRASHKSQVISPQNPYFSNLACGVCLQNTYDYSPFGVSLDGRTVEGDFYRRGFNGMEKDDEFKGKGNSYTTEFRQLDPRLGRWMTIDPLTAKFPWQSCYLTFDNNPILLIDPNGKESKTSDGEDPSVPTKKQVRSIKKEVDNILKDSRKLTRQDFRSAKAYQKEHGGNIIDYTDLDGNKRFSVQSVSTMEDGDHLVVNKSFNRDGWSQLKERKNSTVTNFTNMFSLSTLNWSDRIDVIGISGGSTYTHGILNMRVYSNYTSILLITRGPDFGFWKAKTKGVKYGLHYEYSANIVVGKFLGNELNFSAKTLAGEGWEAGVDLVEGVSLWGSFKADTWAPVWVGASIGIGPAAGGSIGPTFTTMKRF
jgi:RHS repeat-associated protein